MSGDKKAAVADENGEQTSEPHLSSRTICFGGAAACFAGVTTLSVSGGLQAPLQAALYLFAAGLPCLITAGLIYEFRGYAVIKKDADAVARRFFLVGFALLTAAIASLLCNVRWTFAAAFLVPLLVSIVALCVVVRRYPV